MQENQRFDSNSFVNFCFETTSIIVAINFSKAFDSVGHPTPFASLILLGSFLALFSALIYFSLTGGFVWFSKLPNLLFSRFLRCSARIFSRLCSCFSLQMPFQRLYLPSKDDLFMLVIWPSGPSCIFYL